MKLGELLNKKCIARFDLHETLAERSKVFSVKSFVLLKCQLCILLQIEYMEKTIELEAQFM